MIVSITNHKGGTGKTTTAINLATALRNHNKKVLLVDTDPQGNLSYSMGITKPLKTVADLMAGESFEHVVTTRNKIDIIPSGMDLYSKEEGFYHQKNKNLLLTVALQKTNYDFIIIDCPPSFSFYTINVLCATDKVIIPMQLDVLSLQGLDQILNVIKEIKEQVNPNLAIAGIVGVIVDERKQLTYEVLGHIQGHYSIPVFTSYIRANVKAVRSAFVCIKCN